MIFGSTIFRLFDFILGLLVGSIIPLLDKWVDGWTSLTVVGSDWHFIISMDLSFPYLVVGYIWTENETLFHLLDFLTVVVFVGLVLIINWTVVWISAWTFLCIWSKWERQNRLTQQISSQEYFYLASPDIFRRGKCRNSYWWSNLTNIATLVKLFSHILYIL